MKKQAIFHVLIGLLWFPFAIASAAFVSPSKFQPYSKIPDRFVSSSETSSIEWGCPVSEVVNASTKAEAVQKIERECREQIKRRAAAKPDVVEVIQTSIIYPDINVTESERGYYLNGTFFFETLVLHKAGQVE